LAEGATTYKYKDFYDRQLQYLADQDVDGLIDNHYTVDAELLGFNVHEIGHEALKRHFREYLQHLGYIKLISTDQYVEGQNSILFEATVETAGGIARVYDVFIFRGDKLSHHFTGLLGFTPHQQANA